MMNVKCDQEVEYLMILMSWIVASLIRDDTQIQMRKLVPSYKNGILFYQINTGYIYE
jgi:hypothetical protein